MADFSYFVSTWFGAQTRLSSSEMFRQTLEGPVGKRGLKTVSVERRNDANAFAFPRKNFAFGSKTFSSLQ